MLGAKEDRNKTAGNKMPEQNTTRTLPSMHVGQRVVVEFPDFLCVVPPSSEVRQARLRRKFA